MGLRLGWSYLSINSCPQGMLVTVAALAQSGHLEEGSFQGLSPGLTMLSHAMDGMPEETAPAVPPGPSNLLPCR